MTAKGKGWKDKDEGRKKKLLLKPKVKLIHRLAITATQEAEAGALPTWATE